MEGDATAGDPSENDKGDNNGSEELGEETTAVSVDVAANDGDGGGNVNAAAGNETPEVTGGEAVIVATRRDVDVRGTSGGSRRECMDRIWAPSAGARRW